MSDENDFSQSSHEDDALSYDDVTPDYGGFADDSAQSSDTSSKASFLSRFRDTASSFDSPSEESSPSKDVMGKSRDEFSSFFDYQKDLTKKPNSESSSRGFAREVDTSNERDKGEVDSFDLPTHDRHSVQQDFDKAEHDFNNDVVNAPKNFVNQVEGEALRHPFDTFSNPEGAIVRDVEDQAHNVVKHDKQDFVNDVFKPIESHTPEPLRGAEEHLAENPMHTIEHPIDSVKDEASNDLHHVASDEGRKVLDDVSHSHSQHPLEDSLSKESSEAIKSVSRDKDEIVDDLPKGVESKLKGATGKITHDLPNGNPLESSEFGKDVRNIENKARPFEHDLDPNLENAAKRALPKIDSAKDTVERSVANSPIGKKLESETHVLDNGIKDFTKSPLESEISSLSKGGFTPKFPTPKSLPNIADRAMNLARENDAVRRTEDVAEDEGKRLLTHAPGATNTVKEVAEKEFGALGKPKIDSLPHLAQSAEAIAPELLHAGSLKRNAENAIEHKAAGVVGDAIATGGKEAIKHGVGGTLGHLAAGIGAEAALPGSHVVSGMMHAGKKLLDIEKHHREHKKAQSGKMPTASGVFGSAEKRMHPFQRLLSADKGKSPQRQGNILNLAQRNSGATGAVLRDGKRLVGLGERAAAKAAHREGIGVVASGLGSSLGIGGKKNKDMAAADALMSSANKLKNAGGGGKSVESLNPFDGKSSKKSSSSSSSGGKKKGFSSRSLKGESELDIKGGKLDVSGAFKGIMSRAPKGAKIGCGCLALSMIGSIGIATIASQVAQQAETVVLNQGCSDGSNNLSAMTPGDSSSSSSSSSSSTSSKPGSKKSSSSPSSSSVTKAVTFVKPFTPKVDKAPSKQYIQEVDKLDKNNHQEAVFVAQQKLQAKNNVPSDINLSSIFKTDPSNKIQVSGSIDMSQVHVVDTMVDGFKGGLTGVNVIKQSSFNADGVNLTNTEMNNAMLLMSLVQKDLPADVQKDKAKVARAQLITLITAAQESYSIHDIVGGDRDSQGFFQQRPSAGWGSIEETRDPEFSVKSFLGVNPAVKDPGLMDIKDWDTREPGSVAQAVQDSGDPLAYAPHIKTWSAFMNAVGVTVSVDGSIGTASSVTSGDDCNAGSDGSDTESFGNVSPGQYGAAIVHYAEVQKGLHYVWGGDVDATPPRPTATDPNTPFGYKPEDLKPGMDCEGLVRWAYYYGTGGYYNLIGVTTNEINDHAYADVGHSPAGDTSGKQALLSKMAPGDMVLFKLSGNSDYDHIAIYIGNGKIFEESDFSKPAGETVLQGYYWMGADWFVKRTPSGSANKGDSSGGANIKLGQPQPTPPADAIPAHGKDDGISEGGKRVTT